MKKQLLAFLLTTTTIYLYAQPCTVPHAMADLHGNNILATISNDGTLFNNGSEGRFIPNPGPDGEGPSTIGSAGIWIGGIDPGNNIKLAAASYKNSTKSDFFAGPLTENGVVDSADCGNWDRQFKVTSAEIGAFLNALPGLAGNVSAAIAQFPNIMGWPGYGNPYFSMVNGFDLPNINQGLAGFVDQDGDFLYNPMNGDFPGVYFRGITWFVPAMQVWSVFNDEGNGALHSISKSKPLRIEVQQTAWAIECPDNPLINNTIFTAHKIIYKGTGRLDSVHVGIWVDFDLGCPYDDYVGSNQTAGFFAYNQDAIDGESGNDCSGITTFEDQAPVQSVTFLNQGMDKMLALHYPAIFWNSDPVEPYEYYNYLTGTFKDGTAPTEGGVGYNPTSSAAPIDFMFPGDPANSSAWSMCSVNPLIGDVAAIGSVKIDSLLPGIVTEIVLAWTVHPNPSLPCNVGSMYSDVALLRGLNAWNYSNICSVLSKAPEPAPDTLELFPNPAMSQFTLTYGNMKISELRLYAADGRWVRTLKNLPSEKVIVPVQDLTTGMYEMQLITDQGNFIRKLSIAR